MSEPIGPVQHPERWCRWCLVAGVEHLNQADKIVHKHTHVGDRPCSAPWTALCQTEHGRICYSSDHREWEGALSAMAAHIQRGAHLRSGDADQEPDSECHPLLEGSPSSAA